MPKKIVQKSDVYVKAEPLPVQPVNYNAKPFLKWAGGKGQLLSKFRELYPAQLKEKKINNYYEPFLGSGAVFFDLAQHFDIANAYLYDINEELVLAYKVVQQDVSKLIDFLFRYQKAFHGLNKKKQQEYFYEQRANYNLQRFNVDYKKYSDQWIARAAQLIFLNRTCFNGLYRVNSKGEFNTPAGDYKNPTICDEYNLMAVSKILDIATIRQADFKQVKKDLKQNSFVYLDPPYRPVSKTASFTAYSKHDFRDKEQTALCALFTHIHSKGQLAMLSNSDPKNNNPADNFFDDLYKEFIITRVPAKRMINSDASKRGSINEIVVTNYPL
jgi:DNA adenine methylase